MYSQTPILPHTKHQNIENVSTCPCTKSMLYSQQFLDQFSKVDNKTIRVDIIWDLDDFFKKEVPSNIPVERKSYVTKQTKELITHYSMPVGNNDSLYRKKNLKFSLEQIENRIINEKQL